MTAHAALITVDTLISFIEFLYYVVSSPFNWVLLLLLLMLMYLSLWRVMLWLQHAKTRRQTVSTLLWYKSTFISVTYVHLKSWLDSVVVGRWTSDREVASSIPGRSPPGNDFGQVVDTHVLLSPSPSSRIWYWPKLKRRWYSLTGKVTAGLVESNGSLPPGSWLCHQRADCLYTVSQKNCANLFFVRTLSNFDRF